MKSLKPGHHIAKILLFRTHHLWNSTTELIFCWPLPSSLQPSSKVQLVLFQFSFSCFPTAWVDVIVENLEIEHRSLNKNIKYLIFGSEFGFTGPIRMEKIPHIKWEARFVPLISGFRLQLGGRHLVDIIGDISWTKEVTSRGHFWWHFVDIFWVPFHGHFLGEFLWTLLVNFRGHHFLIVMVRVTLLSSNNLT